MKKLLYYAIAPAITLLALVGAGHPAYAQDNYVNQSDIDTTNTVLNALDAFTTQLNKSQASVDEMTTAANKTKATLQQGIDHQYSTEINQQYTDETIALKNDYKQMITVLDRTNSVFAGSDNAAMQAYVNDYNKQIDAINAQGKKIDAAAAESNKGTGNMYLYMLIGAIVVAIAAFAWAFGRPHKNPAAAAAQKRVAYASLAPIAGAGVTFATFSFSSGGGYTILYGPILFGCIIMISALATYFKAAKAA